MYLGRFQRSDPFRCRWRRRGCIQGEVKEPKLLCQTHKREIFRLRLPPPLLPIIEFILWRKIGIFMRKKIKSYNIRQINLSISLYTCAPISELPSSISTMWRKQSKYGYENLWSEGEKINKLFENQKKTIYCIKLNKCYFFMASLNNGFSIRK